MSKTILSEYDKRMTVDELRRLIDFKKEFEFSFRDKNYNFTYDKDEDGNPVIIFGETYLGQKYSSFGELINNAKLGNSFLREVIKTIPL